MQTGEVGIEITPILADSSLESRLAAQLDALLDRRGPVAGAQYFSLSEKQPA